MPRHLFIALLLCLCGVVASGQTTTFADNFDNGQGPGWVRYDPLGGLGAGGVGTWTYSEGNCRMQATGALAPGSTGPCRIGLYCTNQFDEFLVSADFVSWDNSLNQLFGVLARVTQPGLGTTACYALAYATRTGAGRFYLYRIANEVGTTVAQADYTMPADGQFRFVFTGTGDQLKGEIFQLSGSSIVGPAVVTLNGVDGAYTSGHAGVFGYDNSSAQTNPVDFSIDNFSATLMRPALSIELVTEGITTVKWPIWASGYRLQSTDDLRNTTWDDVTFNIIQDGDSFRYTEISENTLFFRLVAP